MASGDSDDLYVGPLSGVRVAEFGTGPALAYCGKLFADFGARVVKVEPTGGDPDRALPPLVDLGGGRRESAVFAWLNTNKKSVIVDAADQGTLVEIAGSADILIDARPGAFEAGPSGQPALRRAFPHLTIVSLSWFGENGPYKDYAATDATVRALAGLVRNVGPTEAPAMLTEHQAFAPAALSGFSAALAALIAGGPGRRFEVSIHEASVLVGEFQVAVTAQTGVEERRWGRNHFFPVFPTGVYPTKDGWLGVTAFSPDQWRGFCDMLGLPELVNRPGFATAPERLMMGDELDAILAEALAKKTARAWADEAIRRRTPLVVCPDMAELMAAPVHRQHGAFGEVRIGTASFEAPVLPQRLISTPPRSVGVAPLAGEHTGSWRPSPPRPPPVAARGKLPLEGLRVIDLTMGWAGPVGTRQIADLGAEVIKVEGRAYPDWWRGADYSEEAIAARGYEQALYFNWVNRNKIGITLDLTSADGVDLLKRLVRTADAVVDNYGQGVLAGFGLDYAAFKAERPDIVMMSMPPYGVETPWADVRAYGSTLEHGAGLPQVTGGPNDPPTMNHIAYGDPIGGLSACPALLAALLHRQRTGEGQFIDLAQVECLFPLAAPWMIEQSVTGKAAPRVGNRHPVFTPHGCFPCDGHDAWIVIAVTDDGAWRALCRVMERDDLAGNPAYATAAGRRAAEDGLEAEIAAWTRTLSPDDAMESLQAAAVACGVARGLAETLLYEPHLMARGYWQDVERPHLDFFQQPSPAFREDGRPYPIRRPAPTLGQSTREVLSRILDLSAAELDRLEAANVIGEAPIPLSQRRPRSSALIHEAAAVGG